MDRLTERKILLKRFYKKDRELYQIGISVGISWFDKFNAKFSRDQYAYFSDDEKREAIERITQEVSDEKFVETINKVKPEYIRIDRFVGEHYYFDKKIGFKLADMQESLEKDVKRALEETSERGYYFLRAIIELYKEDGWDKAYGGATWIDILAKVREINGKYPSPRDLALLKSYKIYYRTGSRRYPTHTIPEEMIQTLEKILLKIGRKKA